MKKIALTGIKPTGTPHIGNYFGAIVPALKLVNEYESRYFIADYHALNQVKDPVILRQCVYEVGATWLACGLDPNTSIIYRQSAINETFELSTILMAFTSKGLMNRAHAYKAAVAQNDQDKKDIDSGINMGLYTYPVLMAADILLFDTNIVPVGKDQVQHVEMAQDIAQNINFNYRSQILTIPEALVREDSAIIPGIDGRKMSKSYGNTIPLCLTENELKKLIMRIKTNSQGVEDIKDPMICPIFTLYKLFSNPEEQEDLAQKYRKGGMGWGYAKEALFASMNKKLGPIREKYNYYMGNKKIIDEILEEGAKKARLIAQKKIMEIREKIGI